MQQPDGRATARTPGQPLGRAVKAGTGTTENVGVCECAYVQETAPKALLLLIPPLFKTPHRSTALSGHLFHC